MKSGIAFLLIVVVSIASMAVAQATWSEHTSAGEYAFARGDVTRAKAEFQAALDIAQGFPPGDRRLETSLENLARLYEHQSEFDQAQPLYQLLLAAQENRLGRDDPGLLDTLFAVARVSQPTGDLPTVVDSLERYAAIADASGKADPRKHWQAMQMLARMETVQEKPERALDWQRQTRDAITEDPGATAEERAMVLVSLAEMELNAGHGPEAERTYLEIAEIREEEGESEALPRTMAAGANIALASGELDTAESLAMRALDASPDAESELLARRVLADISWIQVNRGTNDMEMLLAAAKDSEDLVRARDRLQSLALLQDPPTAEILSRMAQVEALRGQPASAADWQRRLVEALPADSRMEAQVNLVPLLGAAGLWHEALAINGVQLAELESRHGPSDHRLLPLLGQRLELLEGAGQKKEAKKVRKRIKKLSRQ